MAGFDLCDFDYQIKYFDRGGRSMDSPQNLMTLNWGRKLDDISKARLNYFISDDSCCAQLGSLEPFAHSVGIYRSGTMVWYGWILNVEYGRDDVQVDAFDALGWLRKRRIRSDLSFTGTDVSEIFEAIWHDAMDISPVAAEVLTTPTGIFESRIMLESEYRLAWNVIKEMLDTGLDVTAFGQKILAGIIYTTKPIEIRLADVEGDVRLTKLGNEFANGIIFDANENTVAEFPPLASGDEFYPLVEEIIKDSQVQDQQSADNAARSRFEYSRRVPRVITTQDSLVLHPNLNINLNDLIPGTRVIVDTEGLCLSTKMELRLGTVDVTVEGGEEKISVSLQPTGTRDSLADAENDIS